MKVGDQPLVLVINKRNLKMGKPELDSRITGQMKTVGGNYNSMEGCSHNSKADKVSAKITSKSVTLNTNMDPNEAKPSSDNPGVDRAFLAKGNPQMDTTGHGKLTRGTCD